MSNIKNVQIEGRVPFNWLDRDTNDGSLTDDEAAWLAAAFLSPSFGLTLRYESDGYEDNAHGGRTAMYRVYIDGEEALAWPYLDILASVINKAGEVISADALDVQFDDDPSDWVALEPNTEYDLSRS